jgi:hypothetical protein
MKTTRILRLALAVGAGATLTLAAATPAPAATTATATKAIDWLVAQMTANGHHLDSGFTQDGTFSTFPDTGLTIDGLLAIAGAGRANDAEAKATATWVTDNASDYVGGANFGDAADSRYAGALGKLLLFAKATGITATTIDGVNVESDLRGLMDADGRFSDRSDFGDFSNGVGHAFDILGLARTTQGVPAKAVEFLLLQQCPNGGFRVQVATTQCTDDTKADLDGTSFAVMALESVDSSDAVDAAFGDAVDYLLSKQNQDASFDDNANSTGLAASVLRSVGEAPLANKAASYVKTLQLTSGANAGAILVDADTYDAAVADGLDTQGKTLAARSTAQGVLALGLPAYALLGEVGAVEPATTAALTASTVTQGGSVTVTGNGFEAGETVKGVVASDPVNVGQVVADGFGQATLTFVLPASVGAGSHTVTLTGVSSGATASAPLTVTAAAAPSTSTTSTTAVKTQIARTGANGVAGQAQAALALVLAGGALVVSTRRRKIVYPFQK